MRRNTPNYLQNWREIAILFALSACVSFGLPSSAADPFLPIPQQIIEPQANEEYSEARSRMNRFRRVYPRTPSSTPLSQNPLSPNSSPVATPPSPLTLSFPDGAVPSSVAYPSDILEDARQQREAVNELRKRPLQYWRYYASQPARPIRTLIFTLFFCITLNLIFKKRVVVAMDCISKSFWKTLGAGILCVFLFATTTRLCYEIELFEPLAIVSMGVLQFLCLCGLATSTRLLGQSILKKFNLFQPETGKEPTVLHILIWISLGVAILVCFTLVPPITFPNVVSIIHLAPRVAMLLSILGMGALVRTKLGRKELS